MMPQKYRILHTSDWHLGAPVDWKISEFKEGLWINMFRQHRKQAVELIIDQAVRNKVRCILVAGDVADVYGYTEKLKDVDTFLRSKVLTPLYDNKIRLLFALGTHDIKSPESTQLFLGLKKDFDNTVELFLPKHSKEQQLLTDILGSEKVETLFSDNTLKTTATYDGCAICCDDNPPEGKWIEFRHEGNESLHYLDNSPIYRAFGHKHAMTHGQNGCYYAGIPFARSSASDDWYTDAGPRYCLLFEIGGDVTPIRLNVPEVAVLVKTLGRDEWRIFYERDFNTETWIDKPDAYGGKIGSVLDKLRSEKPSISFLTVVIKKQEEPVCSDAVFKDIVGFARTKRRVVIGSRRGIITVMLTDLRR